ncbi:hypothetical protein Acsp04_58680 [Actinomadura sp. NBRC 104425]|uniref:hypothetical protein n=1 Tax=Actinomadura sp. NBRC 104425 TaxID=3032204 RepID=UPI0024A150D2|nr:hypothetical protein [Actinomadura sp. NBRC 104425]GLZ15633.1 hypothetical protein Acsp04_58680 [Actinomadura sp. NBRC 104425]
MTSANTSSRTKNGRRRDGRPLVALTIASGVVAGTAIGAGGAVLLQKPAGPCRNHPVGRETAQSWTVPQVSPAGMVWRDYHGVLLPHSVDGPWRTEHRLASGFARTPRGALLAAVHIAVRANAQWGPKVFEPTIGKQVTGPDTDALLASARDLYAKHRSRTADGAALGRAYVVLEGFRWQGFSPQTASVDVVSAGPGDSDVTVKAVTRIQLQWQDGDWRVVAPAGGSWGGAAAAIDSLDGYTRFPNGGG